MSDFHLAENLKRLRTFHGYRQKDISETLHISRQAYSHYERGLRYPDLETTVRLARFYHISLDRLLLSPDPALVIAETHSFGYTAVTPVGSQIPLTGTDAKMLMDYMAFPGADQTDVREYIRYKKHRLEVSGKRAAKS